MDGPSEELFRFHLAQVRELGSCLLGRRRYEAMLVWETDPSMRDNEDADAFADVWRALPKVVFSGTLDRVQGNARLAEAPARRRGRRGARRTDKDVSIGVAGLAAAAIELGLVGELRMFRFQHSSIPRLRVGRTSGRSTAPASAHARLSQPLQKPMPGTAALSGMSAAVAWSLWIQTPASQRTWVFVGDG